jgi:hypothetical protein
LLLLAAADPLGDPLLLLRAAAHLGLDAEAADAAEEAALLEIRDRCSFCHPLARSAVVPAGGAAVNGDVHTQRSPRQTDAESDPDRRAWHRAQATVCTG